MNSQASYPWAIAYVSAVLEFDNARMVNKIAEAIAAIEERLDSRIDLDEAESAAIASAHESLKVLYTERLEHLDEPDAKKAKSAST